MSDGSHDNPYACLRAHVVAIPNATGDWFICPRCKVDMPKSTWAMAHLSEEIQGYCPNEKKDYAQRCNTIVELPTELPKKPRKAVGRGKV